MHYTRFVRHGDPHIIKYELHGLSNTPMHVIWMSMKNRVSPKIKHQQYKDYYGRGIKVCEGWSISFISFLNDMGEKPNKEYSIDRINNDGNYSCGHCEDCLKNNWPANCRWATRSEQMKNRRI